MNDLLLQALKGENRGHPPVWLMRQAGRFLPEYRALRTRHALWEMFHNSDLAAQVTRLPLDVLGVDAAILFSDILVIAEAFGLTVHFPESGGPYVEPTITSAADIDALVQRDVHDVLHYVQKTIQILKGDLRVPLIGFCGGPFTVASYLIEKDKAQEWLSKDPKSFHKLLHKLACASIDYLRMQIQAGVHAIQIFDSWASLLTEAQFHEFSLHYLRVILDALRPTQIPCIVFCRNSSLFPRELSQIGPSAISFDWHREMAELRTQVPEHIAIQGNLDPEILRGPRPLLLAATQKLLHTMRGQPGFILNLGHGVLPDTPVDNVRCFIEAARR
jgi:uroporphyrinogen decarboxylase